MGFSFFTNSRDRYAVAAFFLSLLTFAVYREALRFLPSSGDDLRILSSVSQRTNPLSYFATDWGMENTYRLANGQIDSRRRSYRPLHSISIWTGYRIFGVRSYPNQLINLVLHIVNGLLLFGILRRLVHDDLVALLVATVGMISMYTVSPAIWVSDRQTLVVALAVLILLNHVVDVEGQLRGSFNLWLVAGLTIVAVSFKESGLIVPFVAAAFVTLASYSGVRWRALSLCALLIVSYLGLRLLLFRSNAFAYASEGFVFGNRPYMLFSDLPWQIGLWARFENVAKNFVSVFLPIIDPFGRVESPREIIGSVSWWLPTIALTVSVTRRPVGKVQWFALAIIFLNSALHVQVFRYRVEYVSQLAFCLYVAASPIWQGNPGRRRHLGLLCCALIALVSVSQVNQYIHSNWVERQDEMTQRHLTSITAKYPVSARIVQQVLARYAPPAQASETKAP
jgi:hypothetical protein